MSRVVFDRLTRHLATFEQEGYVYGAWPERRQVGLVLELPSAPALSPEADAFVRDLYASGFVLQDPQWPLWRGEAQRARDAAGALDVDVDGIRRAFTVYVRTDYAMPGFLLQVLQEGTVVRLLRRLRELDGAG